MFDRLTFPVYTADIIGYKKVTNTLTPTKETLDETGILTDLR